MHRPLTLITLNERTEEKPVNLDIRQEVDRTIASSITVKHVSANGNTLVDAAPLAATAIFLAVPCAGALDVNWCILQYLAAQVW